MYLLRKDNIDFAFVSTAPTHILHSLLKTPSGSIFSNVFALLGGGRFIDGFRSYTKQFTFTVLLSNRS